MIGIRTALVHRLTLFRQYSIDEKLSININFEIDYCDIINNMDSETLAIFADCVHKRSFAAVARERDIDPATVTRAISNLEKELALKLFQRSTRRVEPTEAGMVYFERIEPLIEELEKAKLAAGDIQDSPKGLLRISAPVSFAQMNITPLLPTFTKRYPNIQFDYLLTDADLDPIANHVDISIRVGPLHDSQLIAVKLSDMAMHLVATPEYIKEYGRPQTPEELNKHRCLVLGYRGFDKNRWTFQCRKTNKVKTIDLTPHITTSNAMALKQCALSEMGIALLATWMIQEELTTKKLIDVFPSMQVTSALGDAAAWALYPSREYLPNKTRVFIDFLKQQFHSG